MQDWRRYLSDDDLATIERGKWARPVGYGVRPAVIVIDVQNYMAGEEAGNDPDKYPYAAPAVAWPAVRQIEAILAAARGAGAPIIYTRFAIDREAGDAGLFDAKIGAPESEYVYLEGTHGSEIVRRYAERSGRDVSDFLFHRVLAMFKLAVVFMQIYAQYRRGTSSDERFKRFGELIDGLMAFAHEVAQGRAT